MNEGMELGQILGYLDTTLGIQASGRAMDPSEIGPLLMRDRYRVYRLIWDERRLLLAIEESDEGRAQAILKHMDLLRKRSGHEVIYARREMSQAMRVRLIKAKQAFIVPGEQLYLPMYGIELQDMLLRSRAARRPLSPAGQLVLITILLHEQESWTMEDLSRRLGYSRMTMSRVFKEYQSYIPEHLSRNGRRRILRVGPSVKREIWNRLQPKLKSPVMDEFAGAPKPGTPAIGLLGGLTALARWSMLSEPRTPCRVMTGTEWKEYAPNVDMKTADPDDPNYCRFQVWSYRSKHPSDELSVDPLSLFLTLRDDHDERVSQAMQQVLEKLPW